MLAIIIYYLLLLNLNAIKNYSRVKKILLLKTCSIVKLIFSCIQFSISWLVLQTQYAVRALLVAFHIIKGFKIPKVNCSHLMHFMLATESYQTGFCTKEKKLKFSWAPWMLMSTVLVRTFSFNVCCAVKPTWNNNTVMLQTRKNKDCKRMGRFSLLTQSFMK